MLRPFALSLWLLAFVAALLVLAIEGLLEFETCLEEVMEVILSSGQENE